MKRRLEQAEQNAQKQADAYKAQAKQEHEAPLAEAEQKRRVSC